MHADSVRRLATDVLLDADDDPLDPDELDVLLECAEARREAAIDKAVGQAEALLIRLGVAGRTGRPRARVVNDA